MVTSQENLHILLHLEIQTVIGVPYAGFQKCKTHGTQVNTNNELKQQTRDLRCIGQTGAQSIKYFHM